MMLFLRVEKYNLLQLATLKKMSQYDPPCCPPSGMVLDNNCFKNCPGPKINCYQPCTVDCKTAGLVTNCCPTNVPRGCPNPSKYQYTEQSNPGGLDGPGGIVSDNPQFACAYVEPGDTPYTPCWYSGVFDPNNHIVVQDFTTFTDLNQQTGLSMWSK